MLTHHSPLESQVPRLPKKPSSLAPIRLPGTPPWLRDVAIQWVKALPYRPSSFVEPFARDGAAALAIAELGLADRVIIASRDSETAALWQVILGKSWPALQKKIQKFKPTRRSLLKILSRAPRDKVSLAFYCLIKRQFAAASGAPLRTRFSQARLKARWHPNALLTRFNRLQQLKTRLEFVQADGLAAIERNLFRRRTALFVAPPFPGPSQRAALPRSKPGPALDPERLFRLLKSAWGDCLVAHNNSRDLQDLAESHGLQLSEMRLKTGRGRKRVPLLVKASDDVLFFGLAPSHETTELAVRP